MRQADFAVYHADSTDLSERSRLVPADRFASANTPWLLGRVPNGYWDYRENRVAYLQWLGRRCGFIMPDHWYGLRKHHFQKNCGGGLLRNYYGSSVQAAMRDFLPNYRWHPWLFGGAPNGYWKEHTHRMEFMDWLGDRLDIISPDDWYRVTGADFFSNHGGGLLNNEFNGSVQAVLCDYLPQHPWKAWLFSSVPQSFWSSARNRLDYLTWLGERLNFRTVEDWAQLRREHFMENEGAGVFVGYYNGSVRQAIAELFPAGGPEAITASPEAAVSA